MNADTPLSHTQPTLLTRNIRESALWCGLVYFVLAEIAIVLSRQPGNIASLWLANAALIGWLVHTPKTIWPKLMLAAGAGNFLASLTFGDSLSLALSLLLANQLESFTAAIVLCSVQQWRVFHRSPGGLAQLLLAGCLPATLLGATVGALLLSWQGYAPIDDIWPSWFSGSIIGQASALPVIILLLRKDIATALRRMRQLEVISISGFACAINVLIFHYLPFPFIYTVLPLTVAAMWLSSEGMAVVVLAGTVSICALVSFGLFVPPPMTNTWQIMLIYLPILMCAVSPLILASSVGQSRSRETAHKRSERRFRDAIRFASTGFALASSDGALFEANDALCRMLGYSREELLNQTNQTLSHPDDVARSVEAIQQLQRGEIEGYQLEKRYLHKDGHPVWAEIKVSKLEGELDYDLIVQIDDIGVRHAQQQRIITLSERLKLATSAGGMGVWDWDIRTGKLIWDEQMFRLYFAEPCDGPVDYTVWSSRVHPDDIASTEALLYGAVEGRCDYNTEFRIISPDQEIRFIAATALVVHDTTGEAVRLVGVNRDNTETRLTQQKLENARDAAEAASRAKSAFVANMSHEIRTPMNAVLGMAQLLSATPLSLDQRKYLDMILAAGRSLLSIINDILDFSRIEADRLELAKEPFLLSHVIDALAAMLTVSVGNKPVEVAIGVSPGVPAELIGDSLRLQQILINLCGNAVKFTERGDVSLRISPERREDDHVWLRFSVRDSGIGMSPEQLDKIFSPFSQADVSVTRRFGGSGLGLAIAKRLTTAMEGTISADSTEGKGSTFTVILPLQIQTDYAPQRIPLEMSDLTLLVITGNPTTRECLEENILALGWQAQCATSLKEVLAAWSESAAPHYPDAMLVDLRVVNAAELAQLGEKRAHKAFSRCTVLFMSSSQERDMPHVHIASQIGDAILVKPVTGSTLFDRLMETRTSRTLPEQTPSHSESSGSLHGRVLLVEDNAFNQVLAESLLTREGLEVQIAANGAEALERMRATPQAYDLILMDVQMPVMDGFTATRLIRAELGLSLPIIAMSAGVLGSERSACKEAGMDDFIAKPIDVGILLETLRHYLQDVLPGTPQATIPSDSTPAVLRHSELHWRAEQDPLFAATLSDAISSLLARGIAPLQEVRQAVAEGRFDDAGKLLHALRGEIGSLGAERLVESSRKTEAALRMHDLYEINLGLQTTEQDLSDTLHALAEWADTALSPAPASDLPLTRQQLESWSVLLAEHNMAALTDYQSLRGALTKWLDDAERGTLELAMERLDFDSALRVVQDVLSDAGKWSND